MPAYPSAVRLPEVDGGRYVEILEQGDSVFAWTDTDSYEFDRSQLLHAIVKSLGAPALMSALIAMGSTLSAISQLPGIPLALEPCRSCTRRAAPQSVAQAA